MKLVGIAFRVTSVPSVTMSAQWEGLSLAAVAFLAHKDLIALRFSCRWLSSESSIAFATSKEAQERAALSRCDYDIWNGAKPLPNNLSDVSDQEGPASPTSPQTSQSSLGFSIDSDGHPYDRSRPHAFWNPWDNVC